MSAELAGRGFLLPKAVASHLRWCWTIFRKPCQQSFVVFAEHMLLLLYVCITLLRRCAYRHLVHSFWNIGSVCARCACCDLFCKTYALYVSVAHGLFHHVAEFCIKVLGLIACVADNMSAALGGGVVFAELKSRSLKVVQVIGRVEACSRREQHVQ